MPKFMKISAVEFDWPKDPLTFVMEDEDGKQVDYEKDPLGGVIGINYLNAGAIKEIGDKVRPMVAKYSSDGESNIQAQLNTALDNEETAVAAIAYLKNFYDGESTDKFPHGQLIECDDATKRLFSKQDGYMRALQIFRSETDKIVRKQNKEEEKNLKAIPNG